MGISLLPNTFFFIFTSGSGRNDDDDDDDDEDEDELSSSEMGYCDITTIHPATSHSMQQTLNI